MHGSERAKGRAPCLRKANSLTVNEGRAGPLPLANGTHVCGLLSVPVGHAAYAKVSGTHVCGY